MSLSRWHLTLHDLKDEVILNKITHFYKILGLEVGASREQIKDAYHDLVKVWHPDRFTNDPKLQNKAQEKLKEINEAYDSIIKFLNEPYRYKEESYEEEDVHNQSKSKEPQRDNQYRNSYNQRSEELSMARPFVRFWARFFDMTLFYIPFALILELFLNIFENERLIIFLNERKGVVLLSMLYTLIYIFVESIIIAYCGSTLGRWFLKTSLRNNEGNTLRYSEAFSRSFSVWWQGLGAGIPIISLITMLVSLQDVNKNGKTSWDRSGGFVVSHKRIGLSRIIAFVVVLIAVEFLFYFLFDVIFDVINE